MLDNADVLAGLERLKVERGWKLGLSCSGVVDDSSRRKGRGGSKAGREGTARQQVLGKLRQRGA